MIWLNVAIRKEKVLRVMPEFLTLAVRTLGAPLTGIGKWEEAEFWRDQQFGIGQAEHKIARMLQAGVSGSHRWTHGLENGTYIGVLSPRVVNLSQFA